MMLGKKIPFKPRQVAVKKIDRLRINPSPSP